MHVRRTLDTQLTIMPDEDPRTPQSKQTPRPETAANESLNALGMVFLLLTVAITFAVAFPITWWVAENLGLPIAPCALLVVPIVAIGFGFWAAVYKVCETLGIPLVKKR